MGSGKTKPEPGDELSLEHIDRVLVMRFREKLSVALVVRGDLSYGVSRTFGSIRDFSEGFHWAKANAVLIRNRAE